MDLIPEQCFKLTEGTLVLTYEHASPGSTTSRLDMMILIQEKFLLSCFLGRRHACNSRAIYVLFRYFIFISTPFVTSLTVL